MSFLNNEPRGGETTKWAGGVLAPLPFAGYGLLCMINRIGTVPGRRGDATVLSGIDAVVLGVALLCFAALLHFHFFWGLSKNEKLRDHYEYGEFIALVILVPSLAWVTWCLLRGFGELY